MGESLSADETRLYVARLSGEIMTKSRPVRSRFLRRLADNLRDALQSVNAPGSVRNEWSRLVIETSGDEARRALRRVFGVHSLSEVERRCAPTLDEIVRVGRETFAARVKGKKFAVRARRSVETAFTSRDVNVRLGAALNPGAVVDLTHPDITVYVDVRPDAAHFYCERTPGARGLPLGTQDLAVALVSGGFDSGVAAWHMLKRGVALDYVLCNLAGAAFERSVLTISKSLADRWSYGTRPKLHVVDFQPLVADMRKRVAPRYLQVVLKRLMYRTGVQVAESLGAKAVITGESVGQVSSQTLSNLRSIDEVARLPVLRPLIGMDKQDIIDRSRDIGLYDLSAQVQEYCAVTPERPATSTQPRAIRREENRLDMALLNRLVAERKVFDLRSLSGGEMVLPYLYTDQVPADAVVIDCRQERHYQAWHWPEAEHYELDALLEEYRKLERGRTYVIYCPLGLESAVVAEKMQSSGFEAYSFKGGSQALRRLAQQRGLED